MALHPDVVTRTEESIDLMRFFERFLGCRDDISYNPIEHRQITTLKRLKDIIYIELPEEECFLNITCFWHVPYVP